MQNNANFHVMLLLVNVKVSSEFCQ